MEFVTIPPGTFIMGSSEQEEKDPDKYATEPQHQVTISKPFQMMTTEVTQKMYQDITGENPSHIKGEDHPVERVSFEMAQNFVSLLNEKTRDGYTYRLPTEAEWEYVARGVQGTDPSLYRNPLPFPSELLSAYAVVDSCKGGFWIFVAPSCTHAPVKSKLGLPVFGDRDKLIYDMFGNVLEWTQDVYHFTYGLTEEELEEGVTDPVNLTQYYRKSTPLSSEYLTRVIKGIHYTMNMDLYPHSLRVANRNWQYQGGKYKHQFIGLRLVRVKNEI